MFKLVACVVMVGVVCSLCESASSNNNTKLYLLGLFPMTGAWAGGEALLLASQLAVRDINANRHVLPGFELVLLPKDTAVRPNPLFSLLVSTHKYTDAC